MCKISIVLPVFNERNDFLFSSLESIRCQTFQDWECIVVCESTKYDNFDLIRNFCSLDERFKLIKPASKLGLSKSLNEGISLSKAPLIARMDSDDIMHPSRLQTQLDYLEANSRISVLGTSYQVIDEFGAGGKVRKYPSKGFYLNMYFSIRCGLAHPTVIFKKQDFYSVGGYKTQLKFCEDLDLWLRMRKNGYVIENIPNVLLQYRITKRRSIKHWIAMLYVRLENLHA